MENMDKPKIGFYVMSGMRIMDGPFTEKAEAEEFLAQMCGEYATPELLAQFLAHFDGTTLDLVKDDKGRVLDGRVIRQRLLKS